MEIFTGTKGSYKSYHATEVGLQKVNQRRHNIVVANFPIQPKTQKEKDNWIYVPDEELTVKKLMELSFKYKFFGREGWALLIVDEAGVKFNTREWNKTGTQDRNEWIKWFSAHARKFGYEELLVAQTERMVDKQIRAMADFIVKHIKLRRFWWFKLCPFPLFATASHWSGGSFRPSLQFHMYKFWIAKRYNTNKVFEQDDELQCLALEYGYDLTADRRPGQEGVPAKQGVPSALGDTSTENKKRISNSPKSAQSLTQKKDAVRKVAKLIAVKSDNR